MNEVPTTLYELNHEIMRIFNLKEDEFLLKSKLETEVGSQELYEELISREEHTDLYIEQIMVEDEISELMIGKAERIMKKNVNVGNVGYVD